MKLAIVVVALGLVAGCGRAMDISGSAWARPDTALSQVSLDQMNCARSTYRAGLTPDLIVGGVVDAVRLGVEATAHRAAFDRCMASKGYHPA